MHSSTLSAHLLLPVIPVRSNSAFLLVCCCSEAGRPREIGVTKMRYLVVAPSPGRRYRRAHPPSRYRHPATSAKRQDGSRAPPTRAPALRIPAFPHLVQWRCRLRQNRRQIVGPIQRPERSGPMANLNRGRTLFHRAQGRHGDADTLREYVHGIVTGQSRLAQSDAHVRSAGWNRSQPVGQK